MPSPQAKNLGTANELDSPRSFVPCAVPQRDTFPCRGTYHDTGIERREGFAVKRTVWSERDAIVTPAPALA
jgi:hypothetical protein